MASRPRGGDWLDDEMVSWRHAGVDAVLSLLTPEEEKALALEDEGRAAGTHGMQFISLPILDRQVPRSEAAMAPVLAGVDSLLESGKNVLVHCRQGIGRAGLVAACLLVAKGYDPRDAVGRVSQARGIPVPETAEQRQWIDRYAAILSGTP